MQPAPEAVSRGPPEPYIIEGAAFYNVTQAAQIVGLSCPTVHAWAKHGSTPFGFELDIRREPVTHHRRSTQTPRSFMQSRLLIPAAKVEALRDILRVEPRRPGPISRDDMEALETLARRFRPALSHL